MGAFPVKRDSADTGAIKEALKRLKEGCALILFPEGTRKAGLEGKKLHPGIGLIALKGTAPVIPAYIDGSDKVLPPGAKFFKHHPVKIYFGKPLYFSQAESYPEIAQRIMTEINSLSKTAR